MKKDRDVPALCYSLLAAGLLALVGLVIHITSGEILVGAIWTFCGFRVGYGWRA